MRANRHASSKRCAWKKCSESSSASDSGWSSRRGHDRVAGAGVQLAAAPERELLVRGVAQHRVAEAHHVAGHEAEEAAEAAPRRLVRDGQLVGDHRVQLVDPERVAEHRGVAEQAALERREPVDLGGDHRVDGVGERVDVAARDRRVQQLGEEQRVAGGALGERRDLVRAQRRVLGRGDERGRRLLRRQRLRDAACARAGARAPRNPVSTLRRVAQSSAGRSARFSTMIWSTAHDASSIQWTSSRITSAFGRQRAGRGRSP